MVSFLNNVFSFRNAPYVFIMCSILTATLHPFPRQVIGAFRAQKQTARESGDSVVLPVLVLHICTIIIDADSFVSSPNSATFANGIVRLKAVYVVVLSTAFSPTKWHRTTLHPKVWSRRNREHEISRLGTLWPNVVAVQWLAFQKSQLQNSTRRSVILIQIQWSSVAPPGKYLIWQTIK
jgi:hypothetical protein